MTHLRNLPELVQDSELEVNVDDNTIIHTQPLECRDSLLSQHWENKKLLGRGGDGIVILQQKIAGPGAINLLAVKAMQLKADLRSEDHDSKRYVHELEALAKFTQGKYARYFVRTYGWYQDGGWLYICMEHCKHLDLGTYLRTHTTLSEETAKAIALQVLQGLSKMHGNSFAHRDLKPANILIHHKPPEDDGWWVVLGDLGLSRRSGTSSGTTTVRGTPSFMAPETIGKPFSGNPKDADPYSADMWCLGETISYAITGHHTFSDDHLLQYQERRISFPENALKRSGASVHAINFIRSLMEVEPLRRLTAAQALDHPWITANHLQYTHTPNTTAASPVPNNASDFPKKQSKAIIIKDANGEVVEFDKRKLPTLSQPTQASAQWTQTLPSHSKDTQASAQWTQTVPMHSDNTQASAMWTGTVASPGTQKNTSTSLHQPTVRQRIPEAAIVHKEEEEEQVPDRDQALSSIPSSRAELSLKQFEAEEKLRNADRQRALAGQNKAVKLDDLKKFSRNFMLNTPVPSDLLPILTKDEEKQRQIRANEKERQRKMEADVKREALIQKLKTDEKYMYMRVPQEEQKPALPRVSIAPRRQPYGNAALPPSTNPNLRPPPTVLRPHSVSASKPALPGNQSRPQLLPKAVSGTQVQIEKAIHSPSPTRWEEAVRRQEMIAAQTLVQQPTAEATGSSTAEVPSTQARGKKKKKNKSGGQKVEGR